MKDEEDETPRRDEIVEDLRESLDEMREGERELRDELRRLKETEEGERPQDDDGSERE